MSIVEDNKKFNNIWMKIFWSNDWMKVTDISFKEYIVEKKDLAWNIISKESKWFRLKFEFTNDKWKNKKIMYLQDKEILDFLAVIYWLKKKGEFMRNNPTKKLSIENQWNEELWKENSFLKFQMEDQYFSKIDTYSAFQISNLALAVLSKELERQYGFKVWLKDIMEQVKLIYNSTKASKIIVSDWTATTNTNTPVAKAAPVAKWKKIPCQWVNCTYQLDEEKHKNILFHSNKNFQKNLCFNCQKKAKEAQG